MRPFRGMEDPFGGVKRPLGKWIGPFFESCPLLAKFLRARLHLSESSRNRKQRLFYIHVAHPDI